MVMILEHGDAGMGYITLLRWQMRIQIGVEVTTDFLDDDGTVGDLLAVQFDKRQLSLRGTEFHLVVHILQSTFKKKINR